MISTFNSLHLLVQMPNRVNCSYLSPTNNKSEFSSSVGHINSKLQYNCKHLQFLILSALWLVMCSFKDDCVFSIMAKQKITTFWETNAFHPIT
ncbi:unnamed protein product [Moneuplotes crassus]|uniref:Uncharacterized protein n=1 Tax=Euplotes crassus TaxID=5936 RepID=A0AAD1X7H3_EUPCR|nr:unnamed protein product [Moneuplotes crassus]